MRNAIVRNYLKCCRIKTSQEPGSSFGIFRSAKKAQLPEMRITKQPILLIKSKINRPGYKFSKYVRYYTTT